VTTDERVLVLMPTAKDGERTLKALAQAGLSGCICREVHELCGEILKGASVALVPEEAIVNDRKLCLQEVLSEQPPWSDFPLVVLAREGAEERGNQIRESMNSTLVERPVKFRSLVSVVRAAMRSRRHQYAIRDHLAERKRAEAFQALAAQSNAKFRAFFDRGLNFALVLALDGAVVEANRSCLESYGFAREEIIGRPFWECGWWNRSPSLQDMIRSACARAAAGTLVRNETQYFNAAGEERFVELTIAPVRDASERILFIAATGSDVTERKRTEAQLHDIRSRMEAALAAGAIGTWTWEVASDRFFADQSLARMFALAMEDARGGPLQRIVDAVHPDDRTRVLAQIEKALSSGDRFEADYRVSQNDGSWRWVTARGKVERDENGRPTQFPGVAIDITERKQAEEWSA
jgi:PAS domain S-box-containing protein